MNSLDRELLRMPFYLMIGAAGGFLVAHGQDVGFDYWHVLGLAACLCVAIILFLWEPEQWTW